MVIGHINTQFGLAALLVTAYQSPGNLALILEDVHDGSDIGTLSTNIDGTKLESDEFFVKNWSENESLAKAAYDSGLFEDTGKKVQTGFVQAPIWRIKHASPKDCWYGCMVQSACNPSGVLMSFLRFCNRENAGPHNPIVTLFANKLYSMMPSSVQYTTPEELQPRNWKDTLILGDKALESMKELDTDQKRMTPEFIEFCHYLGLITDCMHHVVSHNAMKYAYERASWTSEEEKKMFAETYSM